MNGYGHLLLCPLCQEIYTHPVLLPCQHSLCYGCARAQILSSDNINHIRPIETGSKCASDTSNFSTLPSLFSCRNFNNIARDVGNVSPAPTLASTRIRTVSSRYGESPTLQCYNETFSQNSICDTDESDVSMLIAPTECLQIEVNIEQSDNLLALVVSAQIFIKFGFVCSAQKAIAPKVLYQRRFLLCLKKLHLNRIFFLLLSTR